MTRLSQTVIHLLAIAGKVGVLFLPVLKPAYRAEIVAVLGAVQLAAGAIAQAFNTDGTPQEAAFRPAEAQLARKAGAGQ